MLGSQHFQRRFRTGVWRLECQTHISPPIFARCPGETLRTPTFSHPATSSKRRCPLLISPRRWVAEFVVATVCGGLLRKSQSRTGSTPACCRLATTSDRLRVHYYPQK